MNKLLVAIGLAAVVAIPAHAQTGAAMVGTAPGKAAAVETVKMTATITAIDKATRDVTLKGPQGNEVVLTAGPEVKNFDKLKAGDVINVVYTEQLTIHVEPPGAMSTTAQATETTAQPGEKPGGMYGESVETKATIAAIDKADGSATLVGQEGDTLTVYPQHPENLDKVNVGDLVVFTHTQKVAVSVAPGKK